MNFENKIVLITGASSGIGKATALMFANNGAEVIITYNKNKKGGDNTINKIQKLGKKAIAIKTDITNEKQIKNLLNIAIKKYKKIDILVNNVGGYIVADEWDKSIKEWRKTFELNLFGMMNVSKYTAQIFINQKSGIIINISSRMGLNGQYDAIAYSASKAGVINVTQSYAKLLSSFGRANSICPGPVKTGYWLEAPREELEETLQNMPGHKLIEPEKIAEKILFLASDEAKNINGQNFQINE
ncbi:MAG: SDR family NAD(P)-dependent oxidoreductase [Patescibacteria group bacterium]|nr:SDR family NAD(P)-dependent oxidoreductase [Patescibacteria group bacterium]